MVFNAYTVLLSITFIVKFLRENLSLVIKYTAQPIPSVATPLVSPSIFKMSASVQSKSEI